MGSMTDFFIKDKANQGKKVPLHDIDGSETDQYIVICSVHSDAYAQAKEAYLKKIADYHANNGEKPNPLEVLAAIIKDWSFDEELTPDNALTFLEQAPHITAEVDKLVVDTEFHYSKK